MTEIGNSIVDEYVNEINERTEDDKNKLMVIQGIEVVRSIWSLLLVAINMFFLSFLVVAVIFLLAIDIETLELLRAASNEDLLSGINTISRIVYILMALSFVFFVVLGTNNYFKNKKEERIKREQREADLVGQIIELSEEVLLRHGLIKKGVSEHD